MRIVILGCGRVGSGLANRLDRDGHDVRVVDQRPEAFQRLSPDFRGTAMVGQGIDEDVLRRAGAESAQIFAAVTDDDNTNIMASQVAKVVFQIPKVITRIYDPIREETYQTLGLETICPTTLGAQLIQGILAQCQVMSGTGPTKVASSTGPDTAPGSAEPAASRAPVERG